MRPLSLYLEGFRSHERATEISFEGRSFIAIVGPTGSGKSSILDGIAYALYGKTPRVQSGSSRLICTHSDRAKVVLRFSVDGQVYQIGRSIPAQSSDYLLDVASDEKVNGARSISSKVHELLGLDFDAFESSVLLAQNKFSRFLDAETTERTKILKGIFRIEQIDEIRKAAVARISDIKLSLAEIAGARSQIPPDAPERLKKAKKDLQTLKESVAALEDGLPEERALQERLKELATEAAAAKNQIAALESLLDQVPEHTLLQRIATEESDLASKVKEARTLLERCEKDLVAATTALSKLEKKVGKESDLIRVQVKAEALAELLDSEQKLLSDEAKSTASIELLASEVSDRRDAEATARSELDNARRAREAAKDLHSAHALRVHLSPGDPCPVCEQVVAKLPKRAEPAALTTMNKKAAVAEKAFEAARAAAVAVKQRLEVANSQAEARTKDLIATRKKLQALHIELSKVVGKVADPVAEIEARLDNLSAARGLVEAATAAREASRAESESAIIASTQLASKLRSQASTLVEISTRVEIDRPEIDATAEQLLKHAESVRQTLRERHETLVEDASKNTKTVQETQAAVNRLRTKLGVIDGSISDALVKVGAEIGVAKHVIEDLDAKIESFKQLDLEEKKLTSRRQLFDQLADDLRNETFINFLLEDRRRLLSDLASERLRAMTGRYRFDDDGTFDIIDEFDGDKRRDTDTLSGGETFLASLALALGLAESAARHGGRLQSFFLDEGFGSLDPESFDLALDGIERIVTPDRLIGLLSHVAALAARVDDKIVLAKDPDGMSLVVSGAS